jgi:DNA-binding LacI/PurR family transcriptional regulator
VASVDDYKGGYLAGEHLFSLGHRNVAVIAEHVHSSNLRLYGLRDVLDRHNIDLNEKQIVKTSASIEKGQKMIKKLLSLDIPPTVVFACNDLIAVGAIKGAREYGIEVPEELSVVGFDNTILSTTTVPELTTIAQPIYDMGKKIVDVLLEEIKHPKLAKERVLFVPDLVVRGTTCRLQDKSVKQSNKLQSKVFITMWSRC